MSSSCALKRRLDGPAPGAHLQAEPARARRGAACSTRSNRPSSAATSRGKVCAPHPIDVAKRESIAAEVGTEPCGEDLVELLGCVRCGRALPLVLVLDNADAENIESLARFLDEHQVAQLHNGTRKPEHHARIDRAHAELEYGLRVGKKLTVVLQPLSRWREPVEILRALLNETRPRTCLGGGTSVEAGQDAPAPYDRNTRARFYAATCAALERALADLTGLRATYPARRKAEREATWMSMQAFGLIERKRGESWSEVRQDSVNTTVCAVKVTIGFDSCVPGPIE